MARVEEKAPATFTNTVNIQGAATLDSTLTVSSTATLGGLLTAGTGLTATTSNITATAGDFIATEGTMSLIRGGAVVQGTSKSTGVTLNKECGKITTHAAALADNAIVTFTVTNDKAGAKDAIIVNHHSVGHGKYKVQATGQASGSFKITITNVSGGSLEEAMVIHYAIIKTAHT